MHLKNSASAEEVRKKKRTRRAGRRCRRRKLRALARRKLGLAPVPSQKARGQEMDEAVSPSEMEQQILLWIGAVCTCSEGLSPENPQTAAGRAARAIEALRDCRLTSMHEVQRRIRALRDARASLRSMLLVTAPGDGETRSCLRRQHLRFLREICALKTALQYSALGRLYTASGRAG